MRVAARSKCVCRCRRGRRGIEFGASQPPLKLSFDNQHSHRSLLCSFCVLMSLRTKGLAYIIQVMYTTRPNMLRQMISFECSEKLNWSRLCEFAPVELLSNMNCAVISCLQIKGDIFKMFATTRMHEILALSMARKEIWS